MSELDLEQAIRDHKSIKRLAAQVDPQQQELDALEQRLDVAKQVWKVIKGIPISRRTPERDSTTPRTVFALAGDTSHSIVVDWDPRGTSDGLPCWICRYCHEYAVVNHSPHPLLSRAYGAGPTRDHNTGCGIRLG
jgi:hypothetical protein